MTDLERIAVSDFDCPGAHEPAPINSTSFLESNAGKAGCLHPGALAVDAMEAVQSHGPEVPRMDDGIAERTPVLGQHKGFGIELAAHDDILPAAPVEGAR